MALDTKQKRMSAIAPASPWRGPMVDAPEIGTTQGNRQAAAFMYSGILAGGAPAAPTGFRILGDLLPPPDWRWSTVRRPL